MIVADDLIIEIAPGADLDADSSTWTWVDITTRVRAEYGVDITGMGRGGESADADTPSLTIWVENDGGDFSTRNPLGQWYPDLGVGTPIRVYWDTSANIRFAGHISELPPRWTGDQAGSDEVVVIRADGFTRRIAQGEEALDSPLFRALSTHDNVVAYWPCEDGRDSEQAASPLNGVNPFTPSGVTFGESSEQGDESVLFGASSVMRIEDLDDRARNVLGRVPAHTPGDVYVVELAWLMPETATAERAVMDVYTTSPDFARWQIRASSTTFQLRAWDADDSVVINSTETVNDALWGQWVRAELRLIDTGLGSVQSRANLFALDAEQSAVNSLSVGSVSGILGRVVRAGVNRGLLAQERYAGHIAVLTGTSGELPFIASGRPRDRHAPFHGFTGELAADRFERLCDEGDLSCAIVAPTGGLRLPGGFPPDDVANASTPDAAALDITGDLDVRMWVAADVWLSGVTTSVVNKWDAGADDRSWQLEFDSVSAPGVQLAWTTDGTLGTLSVIDATLIAAPPDGDFAAIRATLDVDDGSGNHVVTFYRGPSLDGPWTQFYVETIAGTTSIHSSAADLHVGTQDDPDGGDVHAEGVVREARVYDGIDGTLVASPDFTAQVVGATSFDDAQGNTWTVNGDAAIVRADDTMPMGPQRIDTLTNLLQEVETADAGVLSEADFGFVYRTLTALYNQATALALSQPDGELAVPPEPTDDDRNARNDVTATSPFGTSVRAVDVDHVTDHGRYAESVQINPETADQLQQSAYWRLHLGTVDEYRWPQIDIALHADQGLIDDWLAVRVGDRLTVEHDIDQLDGVDIDLIVAGWSERFDQFNWDVALNCVPASPYDVAVFDTSRFDTAGSETSGSFDAGTDTSLTVFTGTDRDGLRLSAAPGDYASTPDHASLDITGDIDLRVEVITAGDWLPGMARALIAKWEQITGDEQSYIIQIQPSGRPRFFWTTDGTDATQDDVEASERIPVDNDATRLAIRVTVDVDNGASDADITFYTAPTMDGPWTQLGDVQNPGSTISFHSGTAPLEVGSESAGVNDLFRGVVRRAQVRDGIGGTVVADARFDREAAGTTSFADSTGKTWTVHGLAVIEHARLWINSTDHASEFPLEIEVSGVVLNVTGISGTDPEQTFTVDATPTNGVEKTIPDGSAVRLAARPVFAL